MPVRAAEMRKAIVAAVGVALIVLVQVLNVAIPGELEPAIIALIDGVIGLLTAFGVFQVRNDSPAERRLGLPGDPAHLDGPLT